jgi:CheY-like chemotaxis protein
VIQALDLDGEGPRGHKPLAPQVIFLDLQMPQIDGFEVLELLRSARRTHAIPVVVVSSSDRPEDVRRSYDLGANSYLVKQFDGREPGGWLADAARYWLQLNHVSAAR